jgi:hypothetical protein
MKPPIASKRPASTVNSFSRATANRTNFFETPNTVASPLPTAEGDRAAAASTDVQQESAIEVVNYNVETTNSHNLRAIASSTIENRPARSETQETAQNDDPMDDMLTFSEILREPRLVHCDVDDKAVVLANVSNSHSAEIVLGEPPQEVADNSIRTPTEDSTTKGLPL